jgi:Xaa-Pro aminopeptidase
MPYRLAQVRHLMQEQDLELLLVSQAENRRYLSGFSGSAGLLLITEELALLITDFRYYVQAREQAPEFQLVEAPKSLRETLATQLEALSVERVGFEAHAVTVENLRQWREAAPQGIDWQTTSGLVEQLRQVKDANEVASLKEAVRIADEAFVHLEDWIHPGVTEREVAWELEVYMRTHGASKLSFDTIVASGANGAKAHALTSQRPIEIGDPIVIDMGCVYNGYCSDVTRSFCLYEASEEYLEVWDTVLEAQLTAEQQITAGMSGVEADAIARDIIYGAGYEGKFGHGLGHGVGLAIHEPPRASFTSKDTLQPSTILTVEPGIYVPDWGGVRIEDMVVVTKEGCEVLTQAPKRPVIGNQ